jgi:hypothetical protein
MQQNHSFEADSTSASHQIPYILRNPKVHYHIHNSPPHVLVLSPIHPIQTNPPYLLHVTFNLLETERNLFYIRISPYRAVNTFHHGYKNQSVTDV